MPDTAFPQTRRAPRHVREAQSLTRALWTGQYRSIGRQNEAAPAGELAGALSGRGWGRSRPVQAAGTAAVKASEVVPRRPIGRRERRADPRVPQGVRLAKHPP